MVADVATDNIQSSVATRTEARRNLAEAAERMGGPAKIARLLGISRQAVYLWLGKGALNKLPADRALKFAKAAKRPLDQFIADE